MNQIDQKIKRLFLGICLFTWIDHAAQVEPFIEALKLNTLRGKSPSEVKGVRYVFEKLNSKETVRLEINIKNGEQLFEIYTEGKKRWGRHLSKKEFVYYYPSESGSKVQVLVEDEIKSYLDLMLIFPYFSFNAQESVARDVKDLKTDNPFQLHLNYHSAKTADIQGKTYHEVDLISNQIEGERKIFLEVEMGDIKKYCYTDPAKKEILKTIVYDEFSYDKEGNRFPKMIENEYGKFAVKSVEYNPKWNSEDFDQKRFSK